MVIHEVKFGETIYSIAKEHNVSVHRLIQDNELEPPYNLATGETILVLFPEKVYTVKEGDTLVGIAEEFNVTVMELLQYNHKLLTRKYIYPGETLAIQYKKKKESMKTNGFAYPFIDRRVLKRTLPYLTYLTIFGYDFDIEGNVNDVDDKDIRAMAGDFGVATVMLLSTLDLYGGGSLETIFTILENDELLEQLINNLIRVLKEKNFYGVMVTFQYLNEINISLYERYITRLSERVSAAGYKIFVIITPIFEIVENRVEFRKIDYSYISEKSDGMIIMHFNWGSNYNPPLPISSIYYMDEFLEYATSTIAPEKLIIGMPVIGYDWESPYIIGITKANAINLNSIIDLVKNLDLEIQFDEFSQTPYFYYKQKAYGTTIQHVVWFIDSRTIDGLTEVFSKYSLMGTGVWNIMYFYPQIWLLISTQYDIVKLIE